MVQVDLRAEPIVLCVPEVEKGRYYSVQLIDMYSFNYGYIGSRATGNGAGCYMVAGPGLEGRDARRHREGRSAPRPSSASSSIAPSSSTRRTSTT